MINTLSLSINKRLITTTVIILIINLLTNANATEGKNHMATLLFEEQFTDNNLAARGWYDGVGSIGTGYKFEKDATLNKNVLYVHWSTTTAGGADPQQPDGNASGLRKALDVTKTVAGVTVHLVAKFHNILENSAGNAGAHFVRFGQSFGQWTPGNSDGQLCLDIAGTNRLNDGIKDPATGKIEWKTNRQFFFYNNIGAWGAAGFQNTVAPDTWYEVAYFVKPNSTSTSTDGAVMIQLRKHGSTAWTEVLNAKKVQLTRTAGVIAQFMIGPYTPRWTNDIRSYIGWLKVYQGDAISDGTIGATTPVPPPVPALSSANFDVLDKKVRDAVNVLRTQVDVVGPQTAAMIAAVDEARAKIK